MKDELIAYIEKIFEDAPSNAFACDLKDEVMSDTCSKYDDCINSGMSEAAAYAAAIRSMGDIDSLINDLKSRSVAAVNSDSTDISPYCISTDDSSGGRADFGGIKGFFSHVTPKNEKVILGSLTAILWVVTVMIYILSSFILGGWGYTWLIFLFAACANIALDLMFDLNRLQREPYTAKVHNKMLGKLEGALSSILWLGTAIIYFLINFLLQNRFWGITWIIFLAAVIIQVIAGAFFKLSKRTE